MNPVTLTHLLAQARTAEIARAAERAAQFEPAPGWAPAALGRPAATGGPGPPTRLPDRRPGAVASPCSPVPCCA